MAKPTSERVRELLIYEPDTGLFRNRVQRGSRAPAGAVTGTPNSQGYVNLWIDGECYSAHAVAWLYMTGAWPVHQIDHKDLVRSNTKWGNLREATWSQNHANKPTRSMHGLKGVSRTGKKWQAQFKHLGRRYVMNGFLTAEEAHAAYMTKAREVHGDFVRA